jgi:hypothetical protein
LSRAVRQLNRVQPVLAGGGTGTSAVPVGVALDDTELAAQEAAWLTSDAPTTELAKQVAGQADTLQRAPEGSGGAGMRTLAEKVARLATALEKARDIGQRDEIVRRFKAEDIDPRYREAVDAYFERLSRDGAKR